MCLALCTIKVKATKREYEKNKLQVVENELYFIILPNSNNARQSRILSSFSYQTVSGQLPKPILLTR